MGFHLNTVTLTPYEPGRLPAGEFAAHGYLFTVPGNYPDDIPAFCRVTDQEMAVYRTHDSAAWMWEVRDTNGPRSVWAEATRRREAVGLALLEVARRRRLRAADIRDNRVHVLGLPPEPPFRTEETGNVNLALTPAGIWKITHFEPDGPGSYRYVDIATGHEGVDPDSSRIAILGFATALLHAGCTCKIDDPDGFFENHADAVEHLEEDYTAWWLCDGNTA